MHAIPQGRMVHIERLRMRWGDMEISKINTLTLR